MKLERILNFVAVLMLGLFSLMPLQASANSHGGDIYMPLSERIGQPVAEILHGQKPVFDAFRPEILALATELAANDAVLAELLSYEQDQYAAAWYGWMPGSMNDETSLFHLPTHGYLAATRAMLLHMKAYDARADALDTRINGELMQLGEQGTEGCLESATTFNTTQPVGPNWALVWDHTPTLLVLMMAAILLVGWTGVFFVVVFEFKGLRQKAHCYPAQA